MGIIDGGVSIAAAAALLAREGQRRAARCAAGGERGGGHASRHQIAVSTARPTFIKSHQLF